MRKVDLADNKDFNELKKKHEDMKEEQGRDHRDIKRVNNLVAHYHEELKPLQEWKRDAAKMTKRLQKQVKILMDERSRAEEELVNSIMNSSLDSTDFKRKRIVE